MKLPSFLGRFIPSNLGNFFPAHHAATPDKDRRPYAVAQIELTSRCTTGCQFCPHDALADTWLTGDMPFDLFAGQVAPHLDLFSLVYLQGWGEPMVHPDLWAMISLAQEKGCSTGFTTNGKWLTPQNNERLLDQGVNLISVSFAGASAEQHQALRTHSDFDLLCRNFSDLAERKHSGNYQDPWLELHFLMTRPNLQDFPSLVELAARLGVDEMVATNLTYSPSLQLDQMHVFGEEPAEADLAIVETARQAAERLGLRLRVYPLKTEPRTLVCDADPLRSIYINHQGEVSPCVYLGLRLREAESPGGQAMKATAPRYFRAKSTQAAEWRPISLEPGSPGQFGHVREGLTQVLESKRRREFIRAFHNRNITRSPVVAFSYLAGADDHTELPLPPEPCRACYKMLGV